MTEQCPRCTSRDITTEYWRRPGWRECACCQYVGLQHEFGDRPPASPYRRPWRTTLYRWWLKFRRHRRDVVREAGEWQ